jgi:hypothetical protein
MKTANMRLGRSSPTKPGAALERALLDTSSDRRLEALKRTEQELKEPQEESQQKARGLEKKALPEPEPSVITPAVSQQNGSGPEKRSQPESEQRVQDAVAKPPKDLQRNAPALERKAQPASEQPAQASAVKAREQSQRNAKGPERKAQGVAEQPDRGRPVAGEKGAARLLKKDHLKEGKGKPSPSGNQ